MGSNDSNIINYTFGTKHRLKQFGETKWYETLHKLRRLSLKLEEKKSLKNIAKFHLKMNTLKMHYTGDNNTQKSPYTENFGELISLFREEMRN